MKIKLTSFSKKKVLITGHTGFKGSWLTFWLKQLNANICGISKNIPTNPSLYKTLKIHNNIINYKFDINDLAKLKKVIIRFRPDYIFHLAAQSLVTESYVNPVNTFTTNAIGTCNILESVRLLNKKCNVVLITSDKSYKNKEIYRGYKESDELGGHDPYSASKGCAEFIIQSYIKSFFYKNKKIKIGVARAGNVIGGGDWSINRVIPDCFKSWSSNKKLVLRNPNATRPWQHVLEVLAGYLIFALHLDKNKFNYEVFNFGPKNTQNKKVIDVIKKLKTFESSINWKTKKTNSFFESKLLKLNSSKAEKKLNWSNKLLFKETLKMTLEWYKTYFKNRNKIAHFTVNQIKNYQKKL